MRSTVLALFVSLLCTLPNIAYAWGSQGHEVVGGIADKMLTSKAKAQVTKILGASIKTLSAAATWADCAKAAKPDSAGNFHYQPDPRFHSASCAIFETAAGKARMEDYVSRNWQNCSVAPGAEPCHKQYHYADVAIQHDHYDHAYKGTTDHDIVGVINASIDVLQGKPAPAPFDIKDKKEALLLLAHFVGDIHQPLHVGAIYLDAQDHAFDPDAAGAPYTKDTETRGGNSIEDASTNLHAEWDNVSSGMTVTSLLTSAKAQHATSGNIDLWPAAWATDTVVQAQQAFDGIAYSHNGALKAGDWVAQFSDRAAYLKAKNALQKKQLAKAGAHLAQLLNKVFIK